MTTLTPSFLLLFLLLFIFSASGAAPAALNITRILGNRPEFAVFNGYLSKTNVSDQINRRQTITVLALDDDAAPAAFAGKPLSVVGDVLGVHVILDYFSPKKLRRIVLDRRSSVFTTLFQASGKAVGLQGFLNVSVSDDGDGVAFGSSVKGSPLVSKLVGSVAARPYVISVIQVTAPIFPPGVDPNPSPPPPPATPPPKVSPAEAPASFDALLADAPAADAPAMIDAPEADSPAMIDAPASSPAYDEVDDGEVLENSGIDSVGVRFRVLIIGLVLFFVVAI